MGHSDGCHEVRHVQQKLNLLVKPFINAIILTLGAVPISAGVVAVMDFATSLALILLPAHVRSSAGFDMLHHFLVRRQDMIVVLLEIFVSYWQTMSARVLIDSA